ncbi:MAG TPA: hypothetical protein VJ803_00930 [Gemmatimonadaceae bacterium]|jgi:hypothetical protein|nr:hypothetical protein [Gemmatimonadaceae bacterium]
MASPRAKTRRRASSTKLERGITRVDQPSTRTHGFVVRVGYRRTARGWRPKHTAFFGDARFGGKAKALAAARTWLKRLERTGKPPAKR